MNQNTQRLVDRTRRYIQDPSGVQQGTTFTDADIVDLLNEEQDELIATMIEGSEDYFAVKADLAFQANVNSYPIFDGCLFLRKLSFIGGANSAAAPTDAIESRLIEGSADPGGIGTPDQSEYFYALYGDTIDIQPTPTQALASAMRGFFVRDPGPLFLETLVGGNVVDASNVKLTSVDLPPENDIMIGTRVHVVAGAGLGQVRTITAWTGATKQMTVDTPFSPIVDGTSKLASQSRIVRLFHVLLSVGAAIRSKVILEENLTGITALYQKQFEKFEDFVYRARTYAQRSIQPFSLEAF